jgi:putative glutamine amidotransferase
MLKTSIMKNCITYLFLLTAINLHAKHSLRIALSKISGDYASNNYVKFIQKHLPEAECINLYDKPLSELPAILQSCSGFVLTGGEDVNPARFGQAEHISLCQIDEKRDTLEFLAIQMADEIGLPILGICRGEQILNVAYGGTLIADIPLLHKSDVQVKHKDTANNNLPHPIRLDKTSLLYQITGKLQGEVNSAHHQAIDKVAMGFKASAFAKDGIIEAIERENPKGKPFFLAVQWHPERWQSKYFADKIGKRFAKAVRKAKIPKRQIA